MEDLDPDLFDEEFEDEFDELDLDEDDLEDIEDMFLEEEIEVGEGQTTPRQHKQISPPPQGGGLNCFTYKYSFRNRKQLFLLPLRFL